MPATVKKGQTLLVTGAAGFIGSAFARLAVEWGDRVVVLDSLTYAGHRENLEPLLSSGKLELVIGDISDSDLVSGALSRVRPDAVVNFAAETHVDRSISGPAAFIQTNILGTFSLLRASQNWFEKIDSEARKTFRYLQVSTDEVFGTLGVAGKFNESSPYSPNSPYAASKASADHLVRAWHHTYGLPTITTHCSNNYGPRQYPEKLIPLMIRCALRGEPLPVYGQGLNVRDWIHVEDHSRGILMALDRGVPGQAYCFGGGAERHNLDVVRAICRHLDRLRPRPDGQLHETGIKFVKDRLGHDFRYAIDDARARLDLGFTRQFDFESGLEATVQWYLDNQAWCEAVLGKKGA